MKTNENLIKLINMLYNSVGVSSEFVEFVCMMHDSPDMTRQFMLAVSAMKHSHDRFLMNNELTKWFSMVTRFVQCLENEKFVESMEYMLKPKALKDNFD